MRCKAGYVDAMVALSVRYRQRDRNSCIDDESMMAMLVYDAGVCPVVIK